MDVVRKVPPENSKSGIFLLLLLLFGAKFSPCATFAIFGSGATFVLLLLFSGHPAPGGV